MILAVPLTDATRRLADDAFLSRMRDGAVLVNVARGAVADTEALLKHSDRLALVRRQAERLIAGDCPENVVLRP